jgi:hypothetical protein
MFILDSLMISGIRWALETAITAAEAEMNDDSVLREQLLDAEMRRELGEITDEEFRATEADLLKRIREIRERREGGSGPLAFGHAEPLETGAGERFNVEASLAGDFHTPAADTPHDGPAVTGAGPAAPAPARPARSSAPRQPRQARAARRSGKTRTNPRARRS